MIKVTPLSLKLLYAFRFVTWPLQAPAGEAAEFGHWCCCGFCYSGQKEAHQSSVLTPGGRWGQLVVLGGETWGVGLVLRGSLCTFAGLGSTAAVKSQWIWGRGTSCTCYSLFNSASCLFFAGVHAADCGWRNPPD